MWPAFVWTTKNEWNAQNAIERAKMFANLTYCFFAVLVAVAVVVAFKPRYWPIFSLTLETVPEVFAKVNSSQFPSRFQTDEFTWQL